MSFYANANICANLDQFWLTNFSPHYASYFSASLYAWQFSLGCIKYIMYFPLFDIDYFSVSANILELFSKMRLNYLETSIFGSCFMMY